MAVARLQADSCNISSLPSELLCSIALWLPARDVLALSTALRLSRPTCVTALVLTEDYTWQQLAVRDFGETSFERMLVILEQHPTLPNGRNNSVRRAYMDEARALLTYARRVRSTRQCRAETWDPYNACAVLVHASLATLDEVGAWINWTPAHRLCATLSADQLEALPTAGALALPAACFCPLPLHLCALLFNRDHRAFAVLVRRLELPAPFTPLSSGFSEAVAVRAAFTRRYGDAGLEAFCTFGDDYNSQQQLCARTLVRGSRSRTQLVERVLPLFQRLRAYDDGKKQQHTALCAEVICQLLLRSEDHRGVQRARTSTLALIKHLWATVPGLEPLDAIAVLYRTEFTEERSRRSSSCHDRRRLVLFVEDVIGAALDASHGLWSPLAASAGGDGAAAIVFSGLLFDERLTKLPGLGLNSEYQFSQEARLRWARRLFGALLEVERSGAVRLRPTTATSCTLMGTLRQVHVAITTLAGGETAGDLPLVEAVAAHHTRLCGVATCRWAAQCVGAHLLQHCGFAGYVGAVASGRWPQLAEDVTLLMMAMLPLTEAIIEMGTVRVCALLRTLLVGGGAAVAIGEGSWWTRDALRLVLEYGDTADPASAAAAFDLIEAVFVHRSLDDKMAASNMLCTTDCSSLWALEARWRHVCCDAAGCERFTAVARRLASITEHVHGALFARDCVLPVAMASMHQRGFGSLADELSTTISETTQRWTEWRERTTRAMNLGN